MFPLCFILHFCSVGKVQPMPISTPKVPKVLVFLLGLTYSCSFFGYSAILNIFGKFWQNVPKIPGEVFPDATISHLLQGLHCGMDTSACGYIGDGRQAAVEPEVNEASDDEDDEDSAPSGLPRLTKWPKYTLQALFKGREPPARPTREEIAAEDEREARNAAADALEDGIPDDSAIEMTSTAGSVQLQNYFLFGR
ncbi:hypothetical protein FB45DRAFT_1117383 [Roridomyces roridus]|uniref:Uncharacterized protein n=1 Tax=Roridomyces roridus TaxID=1738132 RepID=A0AAD7B7U9_9AGAR|nr:hypothetical protein FB45DRAFT_1117383 [Roridomyces roridus]